MTLRQAVHCKSLVPFLQCKMLSCCLNNAVGPEKEELARHQQKRLWLSLVIPTQMQDSMRHGAGLDRHMPSGL